MADELSANKLIDIGRNIVVLKNPAQWKGTAYREAINGILGLAAESGFQGLHDAALPLNTTTYYVNPNTGDIVPDSVTVLQFNGETISRVLRKEGERKRVRIFDSQPLPELADLPARLGRQLEDHQEALRVDAITCLQLKLARPAIVVA
jgi:hypothetical protein